MKKIFLSIAVAMVATLGFNAAANTPDCNNNGTKCHNNTECTNTGKKCHRQERQARCFEGLNLTAEQQAKLNAIQKPQRPSKDAAKNLSDEQKRQMKSQAREQYLAQVKEILTPEQYAKFTENKARCKSHDGKGRKSHDGKGQRNHKNCAKACHSEKQQ